MTCRAAEIELTDDECTVLARIRPGALAAFQRYLDGKWIGSWADETADDEPGCPRSQRNG